MRVVVKGNWVAIEAYGINRSEECQTARAHTHINTHTHKQTYCARTQLHNHRRGKKKKGVKQNDERTVIILLNIKFAG